MLTAVQRDRATIFEGVPTMFADLLSCPDLEGYGMTETASTTTFNPGAAERRAYSVGKPIWGTQTQIWDDQGRPLPPGPEHVGEIVTRGLHVMSTLDAEFFYAEHHNVPMHIGSVAVFDGPAPTREDPMRLFGAKLPRVPRYRQVVRTTPFQLLRPVWADDQEFAIRHHVRHASVPAPGGPEQLRALAARLFARPRLSRAAVSRSGPRSLRRAP